MQNNTKIILVMGLGALVLFLFSKNARATTPLKSGSDLPPQNDFPSALPDMPEPTESDIKAECLADFEKGIGTAMFEANSKFGKPFDQDQYMTWCLQRKKRMYQDIKNSPKSQADCKPGSTFTTITETGIGITCGRKESWPYQNVPAFEQQDPQFVCDAPFYKYNICQEPIENRGLDYFMKGDRFGRGLPLQYEDYDYSYPSN